MRLTQISNFFNVLVQLHPDLKYYHFGWPEEITQSVANNFDVAGSTAHLFPNVLFLPPEGPLDVQQGKTDLQLTCTLYFVDLLYHKNDTSFDGRSLVEVYSELLHIATGFLERVKKAGLRPPLGWFNIPGEINLELMDGTIENSVWIQAEFNLQVKMPCDTFDPDFEDLDAAFAFPVESDDYEKRKPTE